MCAFDRICKTVCCTRWKWSSFMWEKHKGTDWRTVSGKGGSMFLLETVREFIYVMPGSSWFMLVQSSWSSKTKWLSDETGWPSIRTSHVEASKTKNPVHKYTYCGTSWWRVVVFHCCVIQTHLVVPLWKMSKSFSPETPFLRNSSLSQKNVALSKCGLCCLTLNPISHLCHIKVTRHGLGRKPTGTLFTSNRIPGPTLQSLHPWHKPKIDHNVLVWV